MATANRNLHLGPLRRRYPARLPVRSIGWLRDKRSHIDHGFSTYNFSFILRGRGHYVVDGVRHGIEAPTVITQWPGPTMDYGPTDSWEELFFIYTADCHAELERSGLYHPERRYWPIQDLGPLQTHLRELHELLDAADPTDQVDRLDRVCERLVCESLLAAGPRSRTAPEAAVRAIRQRVDLAFLDDQDFDALAAEHGLSTSHFRRLWNRLVGEPPQRHLIHQRLRHACRLLVETDLSIAAIAQRCSFADQLYFARRFKRFTGETATSYRRRYRYDTA